MLNVFGSVQNNLLGDYNKTPHINSKSYILTMYFSSHEKTMLIAHKTVIYIGNNLLPINLRSSVT